MYKDVNEPVEVLCAYVRNKALPLYFRWKERRYKIDKVNLVHSSRRGRDKLYYYSVSNAANYFKLCHDTASNRWQLIEAYHE